MAQFTRTHTVAPAALNLLCQPRNGLVRERPVPCEPDPENQPRRHLHFEALEGPCTSYQRHLHIEALPGGQQSRVTEDIRYELTVPYWGRLVRPVFAFELRRRGHRPGQPWWAPPQRLDPHQINALARLTVLAICSGYIGTLLSQLTTFAGREFGAGPAAQGSAQAATRLGILVVLVATVAADRLGRRRTLIFSLVGACVASSVTGLATGLFSFAAIQVVARGLTTGADVVRAVILAEEMPAGARAYAISLSAMCAGLGSGAVVWLLPIADYNVRAWRLLFGGAVLFAPLAWRAGQGLEESRRFLAHRHDVRRIRLGAHRGRLVPGVPRPQRLQRSGLRHRHYRVDPAHPSTHSAGCSAHGSACAGRAVETA